MFGFGKGKSTIEITFRNGQKLVINNVSRFVLIYLREVNEFPRVIGYSSSSTTCIPSYINWSEVLSVMEIKKPRVDMATRIKSVKK